MGQPSAFGLTSLYDPSLAADQDELLRRQAVADELRRQSLTSRYGTQMAGNVAIKNSPLTAVAQVFQAYMANKMNKENQASRSELARKQGEALAGMVDNLFGQSAPQQPMPQAPQDVRPQGVSREQLVAGGFSQPADWTAEQKAGAQAAVGQQNAFAAQQEEIKRKAKAAFLNGQTELANKLLANLWEMTPEQKNMAAKGQNPLEMGRFETQKAKGEAAAAGLVNVSPGNTLYNAAAGASQFTAPMPQTQDVRQLTETLAGAGIDPQSPQGRAIFAQFAAKQASHQPATSVTVNTGKKFGETLAEKVAGRVAASADAAEGAVKALDTLAQMDAALKSGKVMAGPGASALVFAQQALRLPASEEGLVQTRQVIQGLAKMTLAARGQMKGQGQVSDYEGKLLARAESGDIDSLTVPEIKTLVSVARRGAQASISAHQANLRNIKADPELRGLAPYFDVQGTQPQTLRFDAQGNLIQ